MTDQGLVFKLLITMSTHQPDHEKLFDEICNKLNELSHRKEAVQDMEITPAPQQKYEKMQTQMRKFHSDMKESQEEIKEKIKTLGNVTYGSESLDAQVRQLAEQLNSERAHNSKLSADLAKSLELCLQLQLEIQGLKARSMQSQAEDKKYSQTLLEKNKHLQKELELSHALRDEMSMELAKAKSSFQKDHALWDEQRALLESQSQTLRQEKQTLNDQILQFEQTIVDKEALITTLNQKIDEVSSSFNEVEASAQQQTEVLKNLMEVAEGKIVEMKLALDKKSLEAQDYYSHLQQSLTQLGVFKQETAALKEYIAKLNYYHQQVQAVQQQQAQMAEDNI